MTPFARWLRQQGLSLTAFARDRGRDTRTVQRYASGERVPRGREALELCVDTGGAIQPNSFAGLPPADPAAALAAARQALELGGDDGCTPAAGAAA